jgi:hypothetical protein
MPNDADDVSALQRGIVSNVRIGLTIQRNLLQTRRRSTDLNQAQGFLPARFFASSGPATAKA